jgi:hypothetical protein
MAAKCPGCNGAGCQQCTPRGRPVNDGHQHRQRYGHDDRSQGSLFTRRDAGRQDLRKR